MERSERSWGNSWVLLDLAVFETQDKLVQWFPAGQAEEGCGAVFHHLWHWHPSAWGTCLWSGPARTYWRGRVLVTRCLRTPSEPETTIQKKHPFLYLEYALGDVGSELDISASSSIAGVEQKVPVLHRACHAQRWADTLSGVLCIAVSAHLTAALQTWVASGVTCVLCDLLCPNPPNLIPSLHQKSGYICV